MLFRTFPRPKQTAFYRAATVRTSNVRIEHSTTTLKTMRDWLEFKPGGTPSGEDNSPVTICMTSGMQLPRWPTATICAIDRSLRHLIVNELKFDRHYHTKVAVPRDLLGLVEQI